jgi:glutamyl/glutaminyl-tRNA synthetase
MLVTRFAPSPTGYLHVGGARTALFCWLLARSQNGRMILRIEDTDQKRNTPTAMKQVMQDLQWLGIDWDEGPNPDNPTDASKSRGDKGPYLQSQRLEIYQQYVQKLIESGHAYYCFDTPEELQELREQAVAQKKTFLYPRPERFPDEKDVENARAESRPVTVRLVVPQDKPIVVQDVVRGEVSFNAAEISDYIIVKSDGFPTYHLACVVDDELMDVTHVIRGQEHLMNTPGHIALQQALGFRTPTYAHMSVTVSEGGGKLSKRERAKTLLKAIKSNKEIDLDAVAQAGSIERSDLDQFLAGKSSPDQPNLTAMAEFLDIHLPEINVIDFFQNGYIPEAMVNFIALLGWSPGDNREIMKIDELIQAFDLNRLIKANSLFDRQKLISLNMEHLRMVEPEKLCHHFRKYLEVADSPVAKVDDETLTTLIKINEGARTLEQIEQKCRPLFVETIEYDPKSVKKVLQKDGVPEILQQVHDAFGALETWDEEAMMKAIEDLCTKNELGMGKVAQPIRVAVTGSNISPPIHDTLILLGKEKTLQRIQNTIEYLREE